MTAVAQPPQAALGVWAVLALEWARVRTGWANTLAGHDRASRGRVARAVLLLTLVGGGTGWILLRLLAVAPHAASAVPSDPEAALRAAVIAATWCVVLLVLDGYRRGRGLGPAPASDRFTREWLPTHGASLRALGVRATLVALAAGALGAWLPVALLLADTPALRSWQVGALLLAVLGASLVGYAVGALARHAAPGWQRLLGASMGILVLWSCALVGTVVLHPDSAVLAGAWGAAGPLQLYHLAVDPRRGPFLLLAIFLVGVGGAIATATRAAGCHGVPSVDVNADTNDAPLTVGAWAIIGTSWREAWTRRDAALLVAWVRRERLAAAYVFLPALAVAVGLVCQPLETLAPLATPGMAVGLALYVLFFPALAITEALWAHEGTTVWRLVCLAHGRLEGALLHRACSLSGALVAYLALVGAILAAAPVLRPHVPFVLGVGATLAVSLGVWSAATGVLGLRGGSAGAAARVLRYGGLVVTMGGALAGYAVAGGAGLVGASLGLDALALLLALAVSAHLQFPQEQSPL